MGYRAQVNEWEIETINDINGCIEMLEGMIVSSENHPIEDFDETFIPLVRETTQNLRIQKEGLQLKMTEPLPERILAWREWERLWRLPLTGSAINPHADA